MNTDPSILLTKQNWLNKNRLKTATAAGGELFLVGLYFIGVRLLMQLYFVVFVVSVLFGLIADMEVATFTLAPHDKIGWSVTLEVVEIGILHVKLYSSESFSG